MKNFIRLVGVTSLSILCFNLFAQETADAETVMDMVQFCQEVADEDGTGGLTMQDFLLKCVNEELKSEGFSPVTKLPKA
ncbi:hypothetical protein [Aliiglaciecola sp. LCG003]|uniref:hypothetical protein n=1 Tax=Aliiglaciecola sp. LCG003 TaxID=3053655 RepID=UPI0025744409|nr:hypothetical protein [Aliiglaciecola sp. LCG003]WJG07756.1 hypothetical protein QR722_10295 [Aliiglaciecola sp. LCG003]